MDVGLALPHYDFSSHDGSPVSWDELSAVTVRAESLGFHSAWISDHYFLSLARYGGPDEPYGSPEPLTALAGLAAVTERIRLGTLVLSSGFRHPALVAKSAATIDLVSGGRLDLGLGAGWYEDEHEAFGHEFGSVGDRFSVLEESAEVVTRLLSSEGPVSWTGKLFRMEDAYLRPRPVQSPRPPVWIGGKGGPRLMRLVARVADGWNTVWAWTPEDYRERVAALRTACEREGRDPDGVRLSLGLYSLVGEDERDLERRWDGIRRWTPGGALDDVALEDWGRDKLVGTPEAVVDRLAAFAEIGVEEIILSPASLPFALADPSSLEVVAERVIPAAAAL